jgi:hypothetical protein
METAWKVNLNEKITSELLLKKINIISNQITRACMMHGRNIVKIPMELDDIIVDELFDKDYDIIFEEGLDRIYIYRNDIFDLKHFIQKKNNTIIGSGVKFTDELFEGEEFVNIERLCGEIIIKKNKTME